LGFFGLVCNVVDSFIFFVGILGSRSSSLRAFGYYMVCYEEFLFIVVFFKLFFVYNIGIFL
jgi:hypothetical protein